jgi:hypothetical protein
VILPHAVRGIDATSTVALPGPIPAAPAHHRLFMSHECDDLQGLPSAAFFAMPNCTDAAQPTRRLIPGWHGYCSTSNTNLRKERTMVKRVNKARKSAILEHLLDLERQIRSELARASRERKAGQTEGRSRRSRMRDASQAGDGDAAPVPDVAQRYLH